MSNCIKKKRSRISKKRSKSNMLDKQTCVIDDMNLLRTVIWHVRHHDVKIRGNMTCCSSVKIPIVRRCRGWLNSHSNRLRRKMSLKVDIEPVIAFKSWVSYFETYMAGGMLRGRSTSVEVWIGTTTTSALTMAVAPATRKVTSMLPPSIGLLRELREITLGQISTWFWKWIGAQ